VETYTNFTPFGSPMPNRSFSASSYKYGFNGKEKDDEISVNGGSYDFGARMYDSRLGRWLACDPLQGKYPDFSPYNFTMDNPILFIDPDGKIVTIKDVAALKAVLGTLSADEIKRININKDGTISITAITGPNTRNLTNLQTLVDSKINHNFVTSDNYESKAGNVELPPNVYGRTVLPESDHDPATPAILISPDDDAYIVIKPNTEEGAVDLVAHEAYGHAVLAEKKRNGEKVDPFHKYDRKTGKDNNPDFGKQAWPAIGEARKNFKETSASKEGNAEIDKKVEEFENRGDKAETGIPYKK
jgi:RHS repeat-associated protein